MPTHTDTYTHRGAAGNVEVGVTQLHSVVDYDDNAPPTTVQQVVSRANSHTQVLDRNRGRYYKPKPSYAVSDSAANLITFVPRKSMWIDCATPTVDHLGLKCLWQVPTNSQSTGIENIDVQLPFIATYYLKFRHSRVS